MSEGKTIHQRMIDINLDASGLEFVKTKFVEVKAAVGGKAAQGYYIIPIADILNPLRSLYAKHGLFIMFSPVKYDNSNGESRKLAKVGQFQTETWLANGHVDVTIYSAEGETIETSVSCEAKEGYGQDKLTNKLYTNALRNFLRTTHMIDGDEAQDPEEINKSTDVPQQSTVPTHSIDIFSGAKRVAEKVPKKEEPPKFPEEAKERAKLRADVIKRINDHIEKNPNDRNYLSMLTGGVELESLKTDLLIEIEKSLKAVFS